MQLLGNFLRNLTGNRECLFQAPFVLVRPYPCVCAGIHQLRIYMHLAARTARGPFEHMRNAKRAPDLTQIPFSAISHDTGPTDHLEVGDFRQLGQNVVLDAIGKKGVLLTVAEIFKRKDGDSCGNPAN